MSTRLSNSDKNFVLTNLRTLLNNVVCFVGCPITEREEAVRLWNSKMPQDLVEAIRTFGTYHMGMSGGVATDAIRWVTEIDGALHSALINLNDIGPVSTEKMKQGVVQYAMNWIGALQATYFQSVVFKDEPTSKYMCVTITRDDMLKVLGTDLTDEVISWMRQTAIMRDELILANQTLQDIFDMAQTAGQIKRMVPELMQYLPAQQRKYFEEQKRASSLPFEWAPYPKSRVDVMIAQINKGHLLHNMRKPARLAKTIDMIDRDTWCRKI